MHAARNAAILTTEEVGSRESGVESSVESYRGRARARSSRRSVCLDDILGGPSAGARVRETPPRTPREALQVETSAIRGLVSRVDVLERRVREAAQLTESQLNTQAGGLEDLQKSVRQALALAEEAVEKAEQACKCAAPRPASSAPASTAAADAGLLQAAVGRYLGMERRVTAAVLQSTGLRTAIHEDAPQIMMLKRGSRVEVTLPYEEEAAGTGVFWARVAHIHPRSGLVTEGFAVVHNGEQRHIGDFAF